MKLILTTLKKTLFWAYDRGSWQYDVMCVIILAFIFLGPNRLFHGRPAPPAPPQPSLFAVEELGGLQGEERLREAIAARLTDRYGHPVEVSRIEPLMDASGKVSAYRAWTK